MFVEILMLQVAPAREELTLAYGSRSLPKDLTNDIKLLVTINNRLHISGIDEYMPEFEEIESFSILSTFADVLSEKKSWSKLRVYLKHKSGGFFWVFDIAQIGEGNQSTAPFTATNLAEVFFRCSKTKTVVETMYKDAFVFPHSKKTVIEDETWGQLTVHNAGDWLGKAVAQVVFASQAVSRIFSNLGMPPGVTKDSERLAWGAIYKYTKLHELEKLIVGAEG